MDGPWYTGIALIASLFTSAGRLRHDRATLLVPRDENLLDSFLDVIFGAVTQWIQARLCQIRISISWTRKPENQPAISAILAESIFVTIWSTSQL
jgi:hypothetical protein